MPSARPLISVRPVPDDHATLMRFASYWGCSASEATIRLALIGAQVANIEQTELNNQLPVVVSSN